MSVTVQWHAINKHRLALIDKEYTTGLTAEEQAELEGLQRTADLGLEARDRQNLDYLKRLRQTVESLSGPPGVHQSTGELTS